MGVLSAGQAHDGRFDCSVSEREAQRRQVEALMLEGVGVADPARLDIRGDVTAGQDVFIDINAIV